jgi:pimeloyl-ACP methyl ester carboxylesterase
MKKRRAFQVRTPEGITVSGVKYGNRMGRPLLLLHGDGDSWRSWAPLMQALPPRIRAIAPTIEGNDMARFASRLPVLLDALALQSAIMVGHAKGGLAAQQMAIDHPERVSGLVLIGAFAPSDDSAGTEGDRPDQLDRIAAPALIIWGTRDGVASPADQARLVRGISDARLAVLDGASHRPHREEPTRIGNEIVAFLEAADRKAA